MTTPEQINLWIQAKTEDHNIEFKEAKTQYDNTKLYKYCVAIANEGGGVLLLGVNDTPPRKVVGTRAFNNTVEMVSKIFTKLRFRVDIEEVQHPDGRVLVFHIPSRPKGSVYSFEGSYLMRSGEELVPMSEDRLRKILSEDRPSWLYDIAISPVSGQEVIQLCDTQTFFDLLKRPYPSGQDEVLDFLVQEKLIMRKNDGNYSITNICAILLAKDLSQFPKPVSRKAARVILYKGDSKLETISDHIESRGYAVGFKALVDYIESQLPQNEVLEDAIRKQVKLVPKIAIREVMANALIHQDFSLTGTSPVVEIYMNRVEISNPGEPIVPVERFIDGYRSRNEGLADLMRRLGICEEKSSGIDRVVEIAEVTQLPPPDFLCSHDRTEVVIYGAKSFKAMDKSERVRACYQHCVLFYVLRRTMNNESVRNRFGLSASSRTTASAIISAACDQKLIKLDPTGSDSSKYAKYIPFWA